MPPRSTAFPPDALAPMERSAGAADLCRLQRPGLSRGVQGLAVAAGVAAAARCDRRAIRAASSLDRLGRSMAVCCFDARTARAPSKRSATVLALGGASWPRLGSDGAMGRNARRQGRGDIAAATGQLRIHRRLVRYLPRPLRRPAAQGRRAVVRRAHALRGEAVITRTGIEGGAIYALSADLREAIIGAGQATLHIALRPDLDTQRSRSRDCRRRAASNPSRTGCARRRICRRSASACCRKRRWRPACRCRRSRLQVLPD